MLQRIRRYAVASTAALLIAFATAPVQAQTQETRPAAATYRDIQDTLGLVPGFFRQFPEAGIAGAWMEFKSVQLSPNTKLSGKVKELIGLGIAAQIPCTYCVYFHTAAARANGATDEEIKETIAMAAIVRHWSTVLNGAQIDPAAFRAEVDTVLRLAGERARATATTTPPASTPR